MEPKGEVAPRLHYLRPATTSSPSSLFALVQLEAARPPYGAISSQIEDILTGGFSSQSFKVRPLAGQRSTESDLRQ